MSKEIINTDKAGLPIGPYSQAVKTGNMIFVSGQIALIPETGELETSSIEAETRRVMENLGAILQEGGFHYTHVVKCSIFISDMNNFAAINEVYGEYFNQTPPARETVEVSKLPKGVNVEISCIAVI